MYLTKTRYYFQGVLVNDQNGKTLPSTIKTQKARFGGLSHTTRCVRATIGPLCRFLAQHVSQVVAHGLGGGMRRFVRFED